MSQPSPIPVDDTCIPLSELRSGARARLCDHLEVHEIPVRLADLGFVAGTPVARVRGAPLGDPIEFEIRGYRICLRREDVERLCAVPAGPEQDPQ